MYRNQTRKALIFLLPALILMLVFVFYPIVSTMLLSFKLKGEFVGLDNYKYVLTRESFIKGFQNTMLYTFFVTTFEMIIALIIAYSLTQVKKVRTFFQTTYFLPYVTSVIAVGTVFKVMYSSEYGIIDQIIGKDINWLGADLALVSIIILGIWKGLAFNILIIFTGLNTIDTNLEKAAKVDGFSTVKTFLRIKLPQIRGIIVYLITINIIFNIKVYEEVVSLYGTDKAGPGGSATTIVYEIYKKMLTDPSAAAAIAVILLITVICIRFVLSFVERKIRG